MIEKKFDVNVLVCCCLFLPSVAGMPRVFAAENATVEFLQHLKIH